MRLMLRRVTGTQMVSNFRPTAAAALYDVFVDKDSPLEGTEGRHSMGSKYGLWG